MTSALEVKGLQIQISEGRDKFTPVDGVTFTVNPGRALGIVGESGSGKTLTLRAVMGLLPAKATVSEGSVLIDGTHTQHEGRGKRNGVRGAAMIFQEPMTALNPLLRVETLIGDAFRAAHHGSRVDVRERVVSLMREVGIPLPEERVRAYPHQLSGGLRQRVMIAMALATEPLVLLCDEPTTALDVTVQQRVLRLLRRIMNERGLSLVYVTHDLAVVGELCQDVAIMYAGRIMEMGPVSEIFSNPRHPYTDLLLQAVPNLDTVVERLTTIEGVAPDPRSFPDGCRFHPRCPVASSECRHGSPFELTALSLHHQSACIRPDELKARKEASRNDNTP